MKDDECTFGTSLQKYWDMRYELFSKFDEGIMVDREGLYSAKPEEISFKLGSKIKGNIILDAFGGLGASAIGFARSGKKVICIEKDIERCHLLKNNLEVYGLSNLVVVINGDVLDLANSIAFDAAYVDPPWGGTEYYQKNDFMLSDFNPDGYKILELLKNTPEIVLTVPNNFKFEQLDIYNSYYYEWEYLKSKKLFANVYLKI